MMATSTAPARSASAHSDGTVKESSQRPAKGPLVKPQTSGAVFRYSTMEMRSLFTSSAFSLLPPSFGNNPLSHKASRRGGTVAAFDEMLFDESYEEFRDTEKAETGAGEVRKGLYSEPYMSHFVRRRERSGRQRRWTRSIFSRPRRVRLRP